MARIVEVRAEPTICHDWTLLKAGLVYSWFNRTCETTPDRWTSELEELLKAKPHRVLDRLHELALHLRGQAHPLTIIPDTLPLFTHHFKRWVER